MSGSETDRVEHEEHPGRQDLSCWQRLSPRSVLASSGMLAVPLLTALVLRVSTSEDPTRGLFEAAGLLAVAVLVVASAWWRWFFTRFRVTEQRFELRQGNVARSFRSIPRERIRSVDLTAPVLHRVLGLSVVRIGTGQRSEGDSELRLDALSTPRAELLRELLLRKEPATSDTEGRGAAPRTETRSGVELAAMRPSWYGYSTLTASLLLVTWTALASALSSLSDLLRAFGATSWVLERLPHTTEQALSGGALWVGVLVLLGVLLLGGWLGALVISVEMWWGFRLTLENEHTLRVRRGLLTTRAVSLEKRRLRGVELAEPLLLRAARGGRLGAVATGLESGASASGDNKALLPPAPRRVATRIGAEVLDGRVGFPPGERLRGHPRAALRRRMARAGLVVGGVLAAGTTAPLLGPLPWWFPPVTAALVAVPAVLFARDAYRSLGHALCGEFLVTRWGTGVRRTVLLQRDAIIGWRLRQSPLQRLSGVLTLAATTAAGNGCYAIRDVDGARGVEFAERAVPGLLAPFLERRDSEDTTPTGGERTAPSGE
ncbi:PH domain-containing protein [Actinopolyspora mortivallis]|uniref:PH domain-containing protein n=1 Tax=Actinopolyspora mortivallis TaxID=33906 RepID=UPI000368C17E|nr:PH domain-containing protein [Actinopolyspora mortivallis]